MFIVLLMMLGVILGITITGSNYEAPKLTRYIREMDAIKQWGISKATFIRARKKGLPFVRLGCFVCYKPEDLEDFFCQPRSWAAALPKGKEGNKNG